MLEKSSSLPSSSKCLGPDCFIQILAVISKCLSVTIEGYCARDAIEIEYKGSVPMKHLKISVYHNNSIQTVTSPRSPPWSTSCSKACSPIIITCIITSPYICKPCNGKTNNITSRGSTLFKKRNQSNESSVCWMNVSGISFTSCNNLRVVIKLSRTSSHQSITSNSNFTFQLIIESFSWREHVIDNQIE